VFEIYIFFIDAQTFPANGGHALGRKMPVTTASLLFADVEWQNDLIRRGLARNTFHDDTTIQENKNKVALWGSKTYSTSQFLLYCNECFGFYY
jgi:hypothetical protein